MDAIKTMIRKLAETARRVLALAARALRAVARQLIKAANMVSPPPAYRFTFGNAAAFTAPLVAPVESWPAGWSTVGYVSG